VGDDVRDLGVIQGYEITPGPGAPHVPPPSPPHAPPPNVPPTYGPNPAVPATPASGTAVVPAPPRPSPVRQAKDEVAQALRDIREAHRRGPKPNTRPLPRWVERMAWVLDDAFEIPATGGRRVGVDGFITLIPGIGDAVGIALSMVVVGAGVLAGVSWPTIFRMLLNVAFEGVVSLIPFAGVVFDMAYKANDRNVRLIEADLADRTATRRSSLAILFAFAATSVIGVLMMLVFSLIGITLLVWLVWSLLT
jgi:hypothetical protein